MKLYDEKALIKIIVIILFLIAFIPAFFDNVDLTMQILRIYLALFIFIPIFFIIYDILNKPNENTSIPIKLWHEYKEELENYITSNNPSEYLKNGYCKILFHNFGYGLCIRIQNKLNNKQFIEITLQNQLNENKEFISTLYGIICLYNTRTTTFKGLKYWLNNIDNINQYVIIK